MSGTPIPRLPSFAIDALRRLPLPLLERVIGRLVEGTARRHPSLFARLGTHAASVFLIDPVDLPFVIRLLPARTGRRLELARRDRSEHVAQKWKPVLRNNMRQNKESEHGFGVLETKRAPSDWDARIAGSLAALIGLVHGAYDGDALFFSRDLTIEGNTEAVLALRNAIDDAEIDLSDEALAMLGVLRWLAEKPFRFLLPFVENVSGVYLTRNSSRQVHR